MSPRYTPHSTKSPGSIKQVRAAHISVFERREARRGLQGGISEAKGLFDDGPLAEALLMCRLRSAAAALPLLALMLFYEWWRGRPGLGDVKLAAVAGAWLDWHTVVAVIEAAALAALAACGSIYFASRKSLFSTMLVEI